MPIKTMVLIRRKAGLSPEAFRTGYEISHARIAVQLFGHLWLSYQRNYLLAGRRFGTGLSSGLAAGLEDGGFDVISEYVLHDEAALAEMGRIGLANLQMIKEDEARWFDQVHCWSFFCETITSDLADRSGAAAFVVSDAGPGQVAELPIP